ncbi:MULTISPECIES: hypothetical protein [unclassified Caballeronia]|uniref:hypothetical protein n=1 Tax=unclassified Caballeronia TaxID=2646786 RepID=UPI0028636245|nr:MULTISPECIES: hypothetical protein [unclassified Caballeronia]MDR5771235.1 hypothetical protein [Caballeronia sp. LZ002]MDR5800536.1 hypothetical protein [Caballeronia sp. LZ001]MDR5846671.1 hypothetical protein [Caballeronia sp. LZ003]
MDDAQIPEGVGPHSEIEYRLMCEGKKKLAMFSDLIPDEFIDNPSNLDMDVISDTRGMCTIFYMRGHNADAERLMALNLSTRGRGYIPEVEREIGRLLGYEEWEINAFLAHVGAAKLQESPR